MPLTETQVAAWVQAYERAWKSYTREDIAALFTEDAESHEWPYETHWIGREAILDGWEERETWQQGGWSFRWSLLALNGDTAAIEGTGVYDELGTFANLWTVTFADDGRAQVFRMWNNEAQRPIGAPWT
jgi:hypothetical protein